MDRPWGERAGMAADYAHATRQDVWRNPATLMGTERTGPDLTNIGRRQPSEEWHLMHLYDPRSVVPGSIMPSYPWLFEQQNGKRVATQQGRDLVAYLLSRKQPTLPSATASSASRASATADGEALYTTYCAACHQADGKGLSGAFPPLVKSDIVVGDDLQQYVNIIMHGVDRKAEYAVMPAIGELNALTPEQVTAIINHERTSWGNRAHTVSVTEIKAALNATSQQ
jgi:cytochrome c oxidase cbb3-type subunit 2